MRRTYMLLITIGLLFLLIACGQNETEEEPEANENETETEETEVENDEEETSESEPADEQETASEEPNEEEQSITEETIDRSVMIQGHRDFEVDEALLTFSIHRLDEQLPLEEVFMEALKVSEETDKLEALESITIDGTVASLHFTENHELQSMASAEELYLTETLYDISSLYGIETLAFYTGEAKGIEFGQTGTMETMEVEAPENRGFYVYGEIDGETTYISGVAAQEEMTNESGEQMTFAETIEKMQTVRDDAPYQSGIGETIDIVDVTVNDAVAEVHYNVADSQANMADFENVLQLAALDFEIEALHLNNQEEGEIKIFLFDIAK
ncbi:hypothetical protein ACDX78_09230 [Virgibacillus oceani]